MESCTISNTDVYRSHTYHNDIRAPPDWTRNAAIPTFLLGCLGTLVFIINEKGSLKFVKNDNFIVSLTIFGNEPLVSFVIQLFCNALSREAQ